MTFTDHRQVERRYKRLKNKVEAQLQQLQQQRLQHLGPSRLYLPVPWQPIKYEQPVTMFKVVAAQHGQFTSVFDSRVVYQLRQWTYARCGCGSDSAWPPLWSCLYAYPSAEQARQAIFPRSSSQQRGARVLCRVTVLGKGYQHPDGRVAMSCMRLESLIDYVPKGPAEKVVSLDYLPTTYSSSSSRDEDGLNLCSSSRSSMLHRVQSPAAVQLVKQLQEVAWDVDES